MFPNKDLLEFLKENELPLTDVRLLLTLEIYGPRLPYETILNELGISRSTLSSALKRLATRGLVKREESLHDLRKSHYEITGEGREKLPRSRALSKTLETPTG